MPSLFALVVPNASREMAYDFSQETLAQMTTYRALRVVPTLVILAATVLAMWRLGAGESAGRVIAAAKSSLGLRAEARRESL
jgi:hypothetical protein